MFVGAELLRRNPTTLLDLLNQRRDTFSLVIDATGSGSPPEFRRDGAWKATLARCTRVAICLGGSAALGIVWHHRLYGLSDVERRLFIDMRRAIAWAREPHERTSSRGSWISFPPLRPSVF